MATGAVPAAEQRRLDAAIERSHAALDAFFRGDHRPMRACYSDRDDVTLANPFGPPAHGGVEVAATMERAAAHYRDGRVTRIDRITDYVTPQLAFILEIEHYEVKIGGRADMTPVSLRVTTILRPEDDGWRIIHRHADPITTTQPASSVITR